MSEIPDILRIARKISCGDWRGFVDGFSLEQLADGTELFCHASLLCENSTQAVSFMEGLSNRLLGYVQPDGAALLLQTLKRLQDVRNNGGWLQIVEDEDEEELISLNFPKDVFPDAVERYCDSVAANVQVDRAMICAAVLATSALCMQGRYMVAYPSGNGHREHLCLYVVIIANPGERKSSVFAKALSPVRAWQNERREQYKLELAEYKTKSEVLHSSAESLKKRLADKKTKDEDRQRLGDDLTALALEQSELPQPVSPEIIATDTTVEALASLMSLTGETAGIFTDEADFFKIIAGLYNKGQSGNLGLVLNAYDGAPFYRIRGCGTVGLSRPLLSLCLFAQPVLFAETQDNSDLQGRGMVGRLLFCEPVMMAGKRNMRSKARIDSESEDSYKQLLQGFLDTPQSGYDEMPVIGWENDAADCMLDYLQSLEDSMKSGNPMEDATDYASKAGGAAVRIAGILHLLWTKGEKDKISLITSKKAIAVHCYFFAEKLREMQKTETREEILLKRVLEKLWELTIAKDRAYTTVSALQRKVKNISGLKSAAELEPFLEMLQAQNLAAINPADKNKRLLYVSPYFQI